MRPPTIGPMAAPIATTEVWLPSALPRSEGGKMATTMAVPTAWPMALPTDMSARAAIISSNVGARATQRDPRANSTRPMRWTFRRPTMSATRPSGIISDEMTSDWTITTQLTARRVTPKSSAIGDRATNTIDMLNTIVTKEMAMAVKALHLSLSA